MKISEQKSILLEILKSRDIAKLKKFSGNGGKIDIKLNNARQTLLDLAVESNKPELVTSLIELGADVNSRTYSGSTPIFAVKSIETAKMLVENGADLTVKNKKGNGILYYHSSSQRLDIIKYLNECRKDIWPEEELKKVTPMDEEEFWLLIDKSYRTSKFDESWQARKLVRELMYKDPPYILSFELRRCQLSNHAFHPDLWAAAYVINGGCSDDSFYDFLNWVISIGKNGYYKSISNPDNLIRYLDKKARYRNYSNISCPHLGGVAVMAYRLRTGLDNFIKVINYSNVEYEKSPPLDCDDDTIEKKKDKFPKIWERYHL